MKLVLNYSKLSLVLTDNIMLVFSLFYLYHCIETANCKIIYQVQTSKGIKHNHSYLYLKAEKRKNFNTSCEKMPGHFTTSVSGET